MQGVDLVGVHIERSVEVLKTPRVQQMFGIFDVPPENVSRETWDVHLQLPDEWNIGLIVGPSGSGKTTIAQTLWPESMSKDWPWDHEKSILDSFPASMSIKEIVKLLSSVGFSSPPSWVRPFHVLSSGEQFRVSVARTIAEMPSFAVIDEFSSVVDRTVAQIGSAAIAKAVRKKNYQLIAVSCHYDVCDWLEPDWVYQPHVDKLDVGRSLYQRPQIVLSIQRVHRSAWSLFRKYHYLNTNLNASAVCFCAFWNNTPVAFTAVLHFPHPHVKDMKREHRTVCLPDYQGLGIGNALSNFVGSMCLALGLRFVSETSNPAMIDYRNNSPLWIMKQQPTIDHPSGGTHSQRKPWVNQLRKRLVASFEYVGPPMDHQQAKALWESPYV